MATAEIMMIDVPPGLDLEAIARRALRPGPGQVPSDVIETGLVAAGVPGTWSSSRTFRRLYAECVSIWVELGGAGVARDPQSITAAEFWGWYDAGETQGHIAQRLKIPQITLGDRSRDLGFVLVRSGRGSSVARGPCVRCGTPRSVFDLNDYHICARCGAGA